MGEVYKARDRRLDRAVAIKRCQSQFSERFEREARAIAALNHSHICQLYDVGPDYLVMEYIEGKTLAGPLSVPEALRLAAQIVDALDAAHSKGIVHRDLKPDNILVTRSGEIKLLDFGLAKLSAHAAAAAGSDATLTGTLTQAGTILGTVRYMSPEQLQGNEADSRSDIFAFGTVLYEMIAGRPAFDGASPASIIAAILTSEPPAITTLDPLTPPALDRLIRRCLAKDPEARWQSARDLGEALKWIMEGTAPAPAVARTATRSHAVWIMAALFAIAAVGFGAYVLSAARETPRIMRLNLPAATGVMYDPPVLSPNGSRIAFITGDTNGRQLWIRSLSSFQAQRVEGAENPSEPFWSPDSNEIATGFNGKLYRFNLTAQTHRAICDLPSGYVFVTGSWGSSGMILFSDDDSIYRVPASGGEIIPVTRVDRSRGDLKHVMPYFLPDGRRFLFLAVNQRTENSAIFEGTLDSAQVQRIMANPVGPVYVIGRNLIFARGSALMAQAFDWKAGRLQGEPVSLQENVSAYPASFNPIASFSASSNTLAYYPQSVPHTELVWFDRQGNRLTSVGGTVHYTGPALSPDQKQIAVAITDRQTHQRDIWILDSRGGAMRLTSDPKEDLNPVWSPDGTRIAFTSDRKGARDIFIKQANRTGAELLVVSSSSQKSVEGWSPDGKILIFNDAFRIMGLSVMGENNPFPVVEGPGFSDQGAISPDGKWIAYRLSNLGRVEIYLQSFPTGGARWQLSTNGGSEPSWRRDGKELYFMRDRQLFAVDIRVTPEGVEHSVPKLVFTAPFSVEIRRNRYLPAADGQRFLVVTQGEQRGLTHIVLNWSAALKEK
jgi:serine/threonine protein kinase